MSKLEQQKAARAQLEAVFSDGFAEINGRKYVFTTTTHKKRRKVFAYFTRIAPFLEAENFSFLDEDDFQSVEDVINNIVMYDGGLISKLPGHWDQFPEDYLVFVATSLGVISLPFLPGGPTV